jgi:hypothetical protein
VKPSHFSVLISLLLLLYVLSIGPVTWLSLHDPTGRVQSVFAPFYWPLIELYHQCAPARDALEWYVGLYLRGS